MKRGEYMELLSHTDIRHFILTRLFDKEAMIHIN